LDKEKFDNTCSVLVEIIAIIIRLEGGNYQLLQTYKIEYSFVTIED